MAKKESRADGECFGLSFFINDRWLFEVPDLNKSYGTYEQMSEAIERSAKQVQAAKKEKLNVQAVDRNGNKVLITGVHSGHGNLITNPKAERFSSNDLYADTAVVRAAMAEKRRLDLDSQHIYSFLETQQLNYEGRYRSWSVSMHADEVARVNGVATAAAKIGDKPLADVLAKVKRPKSIEF